MTIDEAKRLVLGADFISTSALGADRVILDGEFFLDEIRAVILLSENGLLKETLNRKYP